MKPRFDPSMSDGCSVPRRLRDLVPELAEQCVVLYPFCLVHDEAYYNGGTEDQRRAADQALYDAILPVVGGHWALEWYESVRVFGASHWGTGRTWDGRVMWESQGTEAP